MQAASNTTQTVLITGLNSYVSAQVALEFLRRGTWRVLATARSQEKYNSIVESEAFAPYSDRIEFHLCTDLTTHDWTDALKGVTAVAHIASPANFAGSSLDDYLKPAVEGTRNILSAAAKQPSVKHVVVTSSVAAVADSSTPHTEQTGRIYTEEDWNHLTEEQARATSNIGAWYCVSKTLAERTAIEIASKASFTCSIICPTLIGGPLCAPQDLSNLSTSVGLYWNIVSGACRETGIPDTVMFAFVDVRDVALAHVISTEKRISGRFILSAAEWDNVWLAEFAAKKFPHIAERIPNPAPGQQSIVGKDQGYKIDGSKAEKVLGFKYRTKEESLGDLFEQLLELEQVQQQGR